TKKVGIAGRNKCRVPSVPSRRERGSRPRHARALRRRNVEDAGAPGRQAGESRRVKKFLVRPSDVQPYSPANHTGTRNFRLIGPETVGAKQLEVLVGEIERGKGALPHSHKGIEQACYLLEGNAHVEVGGQKFEMKPGEA